MTSPDSFLTAYAGRRVAVTGAGGYVGGALVAALRRASCHILRISRRDLAPLAGTADLRGDPAEPSTWTGAAGEADVVFHLAGETSVYAAAADPAASLDAAVKPVIRMAEAFARTRHRPMVVLASTVTIFGLPALLPVEEDAAPAPLTQYDSHKRMAEMQLGQAVRDGSVAGCALRLANVYGPSPQIQGAADRGILNRMVRQALAGKPLSVYGDGSQIRDYVYIGDVVEAFLAAGANPQACGGGGTYTVASGTGTTLLRAFARVAERVAATTGTTVPLTHVDWPANAAATEFRNFVAGAAGLTGSVGWKARIALDEGIDRTISAFAAEGA